MAVLTSTDGNAIPKLVWSIPRAAATEVKPMPRAFQNGRLRVTFADGSYAMAMCGIVWPGSAIRFSEVCP